MLAQKYKRIEDSEHTYQSYYDAVRWELTYIQSMDQVDDDYYRAIYFIATAYYGIGNSEWLSDGERIDAHYISACLFGATSQNSFASGDTQYLSCVYAGMVNHDLLNLTSENDLSESVVYFGEAYNYYQKALEFPSRDQKRIYGYLSQLCDWAGQISQAHPEEFPLQDSAEYEKLAAEYRQNSL